jgi:hypothetical protein
VNELILAMGQLGALSSLFAAWFPGGATIFQPFTVGTCPSQNRPCAINAHGSPDSHSRSIERDVLALAVPPGKVPGVVVAKPRLLNLVVRRVEVAE